MPLFHLQCENCSKSIRKILKSSKETDNMKCECGNTLKRVPKPPTSCVKEILDNGLMSKKVERYSNAEELHKARNKIR